jgi:putative ABC transport system permease protein
MRSLRAALARIAGLFSGRRADDDLRAELQAHLEMETAENIRRGMTPAEARRQALLASGGMTQAAESVRDQRGLPWVDDLVGDLRYAVRSLRHSPAFTIIVVMTLALGIGANTAIFSVVRGVLLRPLPHKDGDRLLYLRQSREGPGGANLNFSVPEVRDLRTGVSALSSVAEYSGWGGILQVNNNILRVNIGLVTGNYFEVMGLTPVLGRLTGPADDGPAAAPVLVFTYAFWKRRFGGDSSVVGKTVTLNNKPVTVIGVLQPAPFFPDPIDVFGNMVNSSHHLSASMVEGRIHRMTEVVGRLAPGATVAQARAQVTTTYARMQNEFPESYDRESRYQVAVIPFQEVMGERARGTLWLLMGAAGFVLIIAAANVANLTLMRGVRREHELVARAALGAGLTRLRRLLLAENLVLTLLGAILGVIIAIGGVGLLVSLVRRYSTRTDEIRLDVIVLGFTLALSVVLAFVLSFLASLPQEQGLAARIGAGGRRAGGSLKKQLLQRALVVTQIAVSVVLLAGAGLLTRTMIRLSRVSTGLGTEQVLTVEMTIQTAFGDAQALLAARQRYEEIRRDIAELPGVIAAGVGSPLPLRRSGVVLQVGAEGRPIAPGEVVPRAEMRGGDPDYFRAAGIPVVRGRAFATSDDASSGIVVVINQMLADRLFPGLDPVGRRIAWTDPVLQYASRSVTFRDQWMTVVGVVGNTRDGGPDAEPRGAIIMPLSRIPEIDGGLVIRADSNVENLAAAATRIIRRIAPTALIENVMTVTQYRDGRISSQRLNATLVSLFGLLAVVIAAVGIAGVLAFSVAARTDEIGIRMSLGAAPSRVRRMILREGGALVAMGLVLGVTGAAVATQVIRRLLFGVVAPHDPVTFLGVAVLMAAIGIVACSIPAHRAATIDPALAMRAQ